MIYYHNTICCICVQIQNEYIELWWVYSLINSTLRLKNKNIFYRIWELKKFWNIKWQKKMGGRKKIKQV